MHFLFSVLFALQILGTNGRSKNDSIHESGERVFHAWRLQSLRRVLDIIPEVRTHCRTHDIHRFVRCKIDENVSTKLRSISFTQFDVFFCCFFPRQIYLHAQNFIWTIVLMHRGRITQSQLFSTWNGLICHCSTILHKRIWISSAEIMDWPTAVCWWCGE